MQKLKHKSPILVTNNSYYEAKFKKYHEEFLNNLSGNLRDFNYEKLNELLSFFEQGAINVRQEMDGKICNDIEHGAYFDQQTWERIEQFLGYKVEFDGTALIVTTPIILNRLTDKPTQSTFNIADNVANAIYFFAQKNNLNLFNLIPGHKTIVVIRKTKKFSRNKIVDNDHLELSRIINTITGSLGVSDSSNNIDLISCYRPSNDNSQSTTFILCPSIKIKNYFPIL